AVSQGLPVSVSESGLAPGETGADSSAFFFGPNARSSSASARSSSASSELSSRGAPIGAAPAGASGAAAGGRTSPPQPTSALAPTTNAMTRTDGMGIRRMFAQAVWVQQVIRPTFRRDVRARQPVPG